ncbi:Neural cell adhesion molecule 1 [Characodon lateralis]|uniref:Neural cell adhesion molecule 1 n=1 Tax=Characodon lateralis TaxID=208331 RepID=A0ABU7DF83_9TELE|nr:Neural cell adhesion molecule 1 [Characodon lateralis]
MCIAVNVCGKAGPGAKSKDIEEGKAAFSKDESKEPIVEVRTEEENIPNQEGGGPTEPNETTPLTEPDGKTVKDDNTKAEKEVKNAMAEVKTVPSEAPQANGNESKA